jgi:hypothetical protein
LKRRELIRHLEAHGCLSNAKAALIPFIGIQAQVGANQFRATAKSPICWREKYARHWAYHYQAKIETVFACLNLCHFHGFLEPPRQLGKQGRAGSPLPAA